MIGARLSECVVRVRLAWLMWFLVLLVLVCCFSVIMVRVEGDWVVLCLVFLKGLG